MIPDRQRYEPGLQQFSWPRNVVLSPSGTPIDALYASVYASTTKGKLYFPVLLSGNRAPPLPANYSFVLRGGAGLDLKCTIERQGGSQSVVVRRFTHVERFGGVFEIPWDGRDDRSQPVPDGIYALRLEGRVMSETQKPLNFPIYFLHRERFK